MPSSTFPKKSSLHFSIPKVQAAFLFAALPLIQ